MGTPHDEVIGCLVRRLWRAGGGDERGPTPEEADALAAADLFDGALTVDGHPLDSLALTEVLVEVEEELDLPLFDDPRIDEARSLGDLVGLLIDRVPPEVVTAWLGSS